MARGRQRASGLAELERQLAQVSAERDRIIAAIRAAVDSLTSGSSNSSGRTVRAGVVTAAPRERRFSAEARKRLSQLAKERWARAKKAGKSRL